MLVGEKVRIRAIELEDLEKIVEWRNTTEIMEYFYEKEPLSLEMQRRWFDGYLGRLAKEKCYLIETLCDDKPIGTISLYDIDWRNRHCEFGRFFLCADELRGKGHGREALELILGFGFNHLNMARIYCTTYLDNHRALSLYESVGFRREGVLRQHIFRDGMYVDVALLSILSDEWSDRKGTKR
ncbi:MAG: GNAT family N-acetyltransferase [Planctomycetota bacterium]|jgi:UDP-4-amino-4,6-dideoxy-N-acetyl-beta-L-altrosamine N-acetyltransferase